MSDTPRMDAAYNQPASTTPRMNWQLDQCYREGCKLERDLTAVTEQRDEAVNNYETAVLREHRMQEQRDRLAEAAKILAEEYEDRRSQSGSEYLWTKHEDSERVNAALAAVKGGQP